MRGRRPVPEKLTALQHIRCRQIRWFRLINSPYRIATRCTELAGDMRGKWRTAAQNYLVLVAAIVGGRTLRFPFLLWVTAKSIWKPVLLLPSFLLGAKLRLRGLNPSNRCFVSSTNAAGPGAFGYPGVGKSKMKERLPF